jgi:hypothetical protein
VCTLNFYLLPSAATKFNLSKEDEVMSENVTRFKEIRKKFKMDKVSVITACHSAFVLDSLGSKPRLASRLPPQVHKFN